MYIDGLESFKVKNLKGLPLKKSLELFLNKIPSEEAGNKIYNFNEIKVLHEFTIEKFPMEGKKFKLCNNPCKL